MRKRKPDSAAGLTRMKLLAGKLSRATELPRGRRVQRDLFGHAASVPASGESLRWLGETISRIANGEPLDDLLAERARPGRRTTMRKRSERYEVLRAQGATPTEAAAAVYSSVATMKRHSNRYRDGALTRAVLSGEITGAQASAYRARLARRHAKPAR